MSGQLGYGNTKNHLKRPALKKMRRVSGIIQATACTMVQVFMYFADMPNQLLGPPSLIVRLTSIEFLCDAACSFVGSTGNMVLSGLRRAGAVENILSYLGGICHILSEKEIMKELFANDICLFCSGIGALG